MPKGRYTSENIDAHVEGYRVYMSEYGAGNAKDSELVQPFVFYRYPHNHHQTFMYGYERRSCASLRELQPCIPCSVVFVDLVAPSTPRDGLRQLRDLTGTIFFSIAYFLTYT